jgi:hypothetical protein
MEEERNTRNKQFEGVGLIRHQNLFHHFKIEDNDMISMLT